MTQDQIKEAIAKAIEPVVYKVGMTHEEYALDAAAAVMALVGPKKLEWVGISTHGGKSYDAISINRAYRIVPRPNGEIYLTDHECGGIFATLEAAQAAAQSYAYAAHWGSMVMADMIGDKSNG